MARTANIIAGIGIAAFVGAATGIALTPGPADAGYGVDKPRPAVVSNTAAKSDKPVRMAQNRAALPKAVEVAEIRQDGDEFILIDAKGREVYRSNRSTRTTTVAKDAQIPLITGLGVAVGRVNAAFEQVGD
jgi:hypothetical protein